MLTPPEILRAASSLLIHAYGQASGNITVVIRDSAGSRLAFSLPAKHLRNPEPKTTLQQDVLTALEDGPLSAQDLAERAGYKWNSRFRTNLREMKRAGLIASTGGLVRRVS